MIFKEINNTLFVYENIKDTPRTAIYLYLSTDEKMPWPGTHMLLGNLLLQGTDKKTAEEIATELENSGIEVTIDSRTDYLKVSIVCLNEDVAKALELTNEFLTEANFKTFDKEIYKFEGETTASLDSPVTRALDEFYKKLFEGHKYDQTSTKVLETLDGMTVEHVKEYYKNLLNGRKIISVASDMQDEESFLELIAEKLPCMKKVNTIPLNTEKLNHTHSGLYKIAKKDAKQAQIFQGWITEGLGSKDCAKLTVLNNILGASGLSSRLFVELRDKRGLAYTVRSSYKILRHAAYFMLYIGTEPSNIKKSLDGFKSEIERIVKEPPTKEELQGAIENHTGKFKYFFTQTNSQIAGINGWNWITGLDFDYNAKLMEEIKKVTVEDVIETAKKYLLKEPVTIVLAPEKYLEF